MDRRITQGYMVSQHNRLKNHRVHSLQTVVWRGAMLLEEIKHPSLRTMKQSLAEDTRLEAMENITKYQQETKRWKDQKVVRENIQDRI